ncbi:unnamed protein product [Musa acuminata var. zebrina]
MGSASPPPAAGVVGPCAACKVLRRRCTDKCMLAPYFPPTDLRTFTNAHRVFGAGNITKLLQEIPQWQRQDAASSMAYEANARMRDPVYGCTGVVFQLQNQVSELQAQLARAQAAVANLHAENANLTALICERMSQALQETTAVTVDGIAPTPYVFQNDSFFLDGSNVPGYTREPPLRT